MSLSSLRSAYGRAFSHFIHLRGCSLSLWMCVSRVSTQTTHTHTHTHTQNSLFFLLIPRLLMLSFQLSRLLSSLSLPLFIPFSRPSVRMPCERARVSSATVASVSARSPCAIPSPTQSKRRSPAPPFSPLHLFRHLCLNPTASAAQLHPSGGRLREVS